MTRVRSGGRALVAELHRELAGTRRSGPLLMLWRWRWECVLVLTAAALVWLVPASVLLGVVGFLVASCTVFSRARNLLRDRFWCIATQHRFRTGMSESGVRSWSGRMPAILWTSSRPDGEQLLLSCPAGVDVRRIEAARGELAAACWAVDTAVEQDTRHANFVLVRVVRRRP
jgi:hypothetical protein